MQLNRSGRNSPGMYTSGQMVREPTIIHIYHSLRGFCRPEAGVLKRDSNKTSVMD